MTKQTKTIAVATISVSLLLAIYFVWLALYNVKKKGGALGTAAGAKAIADYNSTLPNTAPIQLDNGSAVVVPDVLGLQAGTPPIDLSAYKMDTTEYISQSDYFTIYNYYASQGMGADAAQTAAINFIHSKNLKYAQYPGISIDNYFNS